MVSRSTDQVVLTALLALGSDAFQPAEWGFLINLNNTWRGDFTNRQREWLSDLADKHGVGGDA
jgi:predicted ATP-grasp superfamily ATP-dependent carboligase